MHNRITKAPRYIQSCLMWIYVCVYNLYFSISQCQIVVEHTLHGAYIHTVSILCIYLMPFRWTSLVLPDISHPYGQLPNQKWYWCSIKKKPVCVVCIFCSISYPPPITLVFEQQSSYYRYWLHIACEITQPPLVVTALTVSSGYVHTYFAVPIWLGVPHVILALSHLCLLSRVCIASASQCPTYSCLCLHLVLLPCHS